MKIEITGLLFDLKSFDDGHSIASVHVHPDTAMVVRHFPKNERCHEFVSVDLGHLDDPGVRVSVYAEPADAERLAAEIMVALKKAKEAA